MNRNERTIARLGPIACGRCCGASPSSSSGPLETIPPRPRSPATSCWCGPVTCAGWRPVFTRGCRSAWRYFGNVERIVRDEMIAIGSQEVHLPALIPREVFDGSGRWADYGDALFRLKDRRGADYLLGPTHEELFTLLVKGEYSSYKDFPLSLFQIQTKYRDEARPRAGVLRGREFVMKDSYSFDIDDAGLARSYLDHRDAYERIFGRLDLDYRIVAALSGAMGGSASEEFLAPTPAGEDTFVQCSELRLRSQH